MKVTQTGYLQTETIIKALEFTLQRGGFGASARHKKIAATLLKSMKGNQSISGRHQQLASLLRKGATLSQLIKGIGASRRTIFRYLNHFETAGFEVEVENGLYRLRSE